MAKVILLNLEDIANCSDLTDEEFGRLVRLLTEYQQTQTNPTLANEKGAVKMAFNFMKSFIDRQNAKYEAQCVNGKKGGRPKKAEAEVKPTETQENLTKTKTITKTNTNIEEKSIKRNVFVKPTVEEIKAYCDERKNHIDASKFYDYYEARNWELGKGRKVKDWKACVRTWEHNNFATDKSYQEVKPDWQTDEWLKEWEDNLNV